MSKICNKIFIIICSIFLIFPFTINAEEEFKSLKELKEGLAKYEAERDMLKARQRQIQNEISKANNDIAKAHADIEKAQQDIEASKQKIVELDAEIVEKNKEIENLLTFLQVADGDNVYLEYIFGASSFTDFIYRSSIVTQLTNHNDELIVQMNEMIEENKQLQKDLAEDIKENEKALDNLQKVLKESNLDMKDLNEEQEDIDADIDATKKMVEWVASMYKDAGCAEDVDMYSCINVTISSGFTRPTDKGTITSNYGMRLHPTLGYYRLHAGMDIALPSGSKVYASTSGVVSKITKKASCGGNMVYIQHNVGGTKYRTVYMHLKKINVKLGDVVYLNTVIGLSGGTESYDGCSTGAHLHFGIYKGWTGSTYVNPRNYINFPAKGGKYTSRFY